MPKRTRSAASHAPAAVVASSPDGDAAATPMDIDAIDSSSPAPVAAAAAATGAPPARRHGRAAKSAQLANIAPAASWAARAEERPPKRKRAKKAEGDQLEAEEAAAAADGGNAAKKKAAASTPPRKKKPKRTAGEAEDDEMADVSRSAPSRRPFTCDCNSLSVILSFLNMRDFLSSTRVSRQWRAASSTHIAWPKQSIESLIESLQSDNYDDPNVRRLRIHPNQDDRFDHVARLLQSRSFSQVNDIRFVTSAQCTRPKERADVQAAMIDLAKFPYLQTLNLCTTYAHLRQDPRPDQPDDDFVGRFCQAVGGKLRALFLSAPCNSSLDAMAALFEPHLHHLTNLRVLVVDDAISGNTLWQLPQLEFFHGRLSYGDNTLLLDAIRTLSVEHSLRGVSLLLYGGWDQGDNLIRSLCALPPKPTYNGAPPPPTFQPTTKPAELTTLAFHGSAFTTSDLQLVAEHLPQMKHLDVDWRPSDQIAWDWRFDLPQLETLKLQLSLVGQSAFDFCPQPFLPQCPKVTTFSLTGGSLVYEPDFLRMSRAWLVSLLAIHFPSVEHLRIGDWTPIDEPTLVQENAAAAAAAAATSSEPAAAAAVASSSSSRTSRSSTAAATNWPSVTPIAPLSSQEKKEADDNKQKEEAFRRLAARCPHLRTIDLDMVPQVDLRHLLPMIHRLTDFHTLEVSCRPSRYGGGGTFFLPSELYTAVATHPTFRVLRVHVSHTLLDGRTEVTNSWSPDAKCYRFPDVPTVPQIANAAAKQPGRTAQIVSEEVVRRRLAAFRLFRHSESTNDREPTVKVFGLQPLEGQSNRPAWIWRKEQRDE